MKIIDLIKDVEIIESDVNFEIDIADIFDNSKKVTENGCFIAHKGFVFDGHDYINEAIEKGAILIVCENKEVYGNLTNVNKVLVNDGRKA